MPVINPTGINTASSESVVASTARPISRVPSIAALKRGHSLFLDEAVNILEHDDRVVDHDTDHQRQGKHRHLVQRVTERGDERERRDDRDRDSQGRDDGRPDIPEEEKDDDRGKNRAEDKMFLDGVERLFSINSDWSRTMAILRSEGRFGMIWSIRPLMLLMTAMVLAPDCLRIANGDRLDAVERRRGRGIHAAVLDPADVLELDRKAVLRGDDDVVKLSDLGKLTDGAQADRA